MDVIQLKKELLEAVEKYRRKYPAISLNNIAKRAGRSEGTLRKLLSFENLGTPRPDTLLSVMMVLLEKKDVHSVIQEAPQLISEYLHRSFPMYKDSPAKANMNSRVEAEINDRESFIIVWLCGTQEGATREEICRLMGKLGEQRLDDLLSAEILQVDGKGVMRTIEENLYISPEISKKYIGEFFRFWKIGQMGQQRNIMYALMESISEEFQSEVIDILSEAYRKIREKSQDPANKGPIKFVTMVYGESVIL